jgi:hypothetical protein
MDDKNKGLTEQIRSLVEDSSQTRQALIALLTERTAVSSDVPRTWPEFMWYVTRTQGIVVAVLLAILASLAYAMARIYTHSIEPWVMSNVAAVQQVGQSMEAQTNVLEDIYDETKRQTSDLQELSDTTKASHTILQKLDADTP